MTYALPFLFDFWNIFILCYICHHCSLGNVTIVTLPTLQSQLLEITRTGQTLQHFFRFSRRWPPPSWFCDKGQIRQYCLIIGNDTSVYITYCEDVLKWNKYWVLFSKFLIKAAIPTWISLQIVYVAMNDRPLSVSLYTYFSIFMEIIQVDQKCEI